MGVKQALVNYTLDVEVVVVGESVRLWYKSPISRGLSRPW
jgi:hypothetical protein